MTSSSTSTNVQALLADLRDAPVGTASDHVLSTVLEYLMGVSPTPPNGTFHWFCHHASPVTVDAATFLIRLFAYQSEHVDPWKIRMHSCLSRCGECVQGFERVKISSRDTYFGAFDKDVLRDFYDSFEQWELEGVLQDLAKANMLDPPASGSRTLSDAPSTVVYRMVSNWTIFKNPRIQTLIHAHTPTEPISGWPTDIVPAGILVLLMHDSPKVRTWAIDQASKCDVVPIPNAQFIGTYIKAIESIGRSLNLKGTRPTGAEDSTLMFASNESDLWHGLFYVLRYTPTESLKSNSQQNADLRRVIIGHAHDTGPHFFDVLRCLALLVKRLNKSIWDGEGPEFPQVVFDSIKDNPSLSKIILDLGASESDVSPWILGLFRDYIQSIRDSPVFGEILAKMADFLCEETQHERFKDVRPVTMSWGVRLLHSVLRSEHASTKSAPHIAAVNKVLDIHGDVFVRVAFSRQYGEDQWCTARTRARALVTQILDNDAITVKKAVSTVCTILAHTSKSLPGTPSIPILSIRQGMWAKFYSMLQTHDIDGVAILISLVAKTAHLSSIDPKPFKGAFETVPEAEGVLKEVNRSLAKMRAGLVAAITEFENHNLSTSALDLLQRPNVAKYVMLLMLSPVDDLQVAAQILVRVAYDVDARQECFRALLENVPGPAFEGIFEFLSAHAMYADQWPEACSLSKSLVSCFTDIIEVLCTTPNGLLHSPRFLQSSKDDGPASMLPKLWSLMAKSITIIFKRTPTWSLYFESKMLVDWMRDALIYGRDMLEKWRVIETAANTRPSDEEVKPGELSLLGKKMMQTFQDVLLELTKWLRLTDEELLHQAFSLLTSLLDCFRKANITPKEENMKKLRRHIDNARTGGAGGPRTRLDTGRLLLLEVALDDVENIEISPLKKPSPPPEVPLPPTVAVKPVDTVKKNYIQGGTTKSASGLSSSSAHRLSLSKLKATTAGPSKSTKSISRFFTDKDKELLEADIAIPSFRKPTKIPTTVAPVAPAASTLPNGAGSEKSVVSVSDSSSESDNDDDEDEDDTNKEKPQGGLASLNKLQRSPKISKAPERRQTKLLELPNQTSRADLQHLERMKRRDEARIAAARLKPDISGLHKVLLSWDYNHTGSTPPGEKLKLNQVPPRFNNFTDYENFLKPLLLLECWAQITNAKETTPDIVECTVTSRQFTDSWLDIDISVEGSIKKDWYLGETDLVLLSNAINGKRIMAKTQSYRNSPHQGTQATLRCIVNNGDPGLQMNTKWRLNKLVNLATLHREFAALVSVKYYDFADIILQPRLSKAAKPERRDIDQTMSIYGLNEPQATAILCSLRTEGFTLIQGPPGTGKTSTICGLVAACLSMRARAPVAVHVGRNTTPMEKKTTPKILVCAPSNAAIDEIASRLSTGLRGSEKGSMPVKVVRIGAPGGISSSVLDIFLETLVEQKLDPKQAQSNDAGPAQIQALKRDVESLKQLIAEKHQEKAAIIDNNVRTHALADEISQLNGRRTQLAKQLNNLRDKQRADTRGLDALRRKTRIEVLREADVICSTLSGSANEQLEQIDIDMVIIDEAAQAIELSSLIPLKYRFKRCIMVGDPKQLPPTVLSKDACKYNYNESLFVRLQKQRPDTVHLLSIQYRMHPEISRLPSHIFYQSRLLDGPGLDVKTKQPWQAHGKFGTYRFFNVARGLEESAQGRSLKNKAECEVAVALYARLRLEFSNINWDYRVGVISMYSAQLYEIRRQFEQRFGKEVLETVDFKTVDGFQGQEKDVIILSCVRAGPGVQSVGFLADDRRMNVALTRAKSSLFILGNAPTLERSDPTWRAIVLDARSRSTLVDTDPTYFTRTVTTPIRPTQTPKVAKVVPPASIPTDLVAPRNFKTAMQMKEAPPTSQGIPSTSTLDSSHRSATIGPAPRPVADERSTAKIQSTRPQPHFNHPSSTGPGPVADEKSMANNHSTRPQPQPQANSNVKQRKPSAKRPKEAALFIPRPKKRPPDDNASGASNRRRIT